MPEPTLYPLSQTQQLNMWSRTFTVHKQVNNIATSVLVEAPLDLDALRAAVDEAIAGNDSFGIRITKRDKKNLQYFGERRALLIDTADFIGRPEAEMEAFFAKVARTPLPIFDTPLAKIYVVRAPDGACGLFSCISHFSMDTWAIYQFYRVAFGTYFARTAGEAMPEPVLPFEELVKREIAYEGSPREEKDREFWRAEIASYGGRRPSYAHVNGTKFRDTWRKVVRKPDHPYARVTFLRTTARHEVVPIDKADLEAMAAFCEEHRVSMGVLFQVGFRSYLAAVSEKTDDVTIAITLARRGTLAEKKSGGDRATGGHLRMIIPPETTFLDALALVGRKQNEVLRHADLALLDVMALEREAYGVKSYESFAPMVYTFQIIPMDLGNDLRIRTEWYSTGTAQMQLYVMVMGGPDGSLQVVYEYWDKQIKRATLLRSHAYMMDVIRAGIANPQITIGETLNLPMLSSQPR